MDKKSRSHTVEGQEAAASALGFSDVEEGVKVVANARRLNLPGCLPGGRYHIPTLRKSIAKNAEILKAKGEKISLKDQKTNEEIRKLRIANDAKERLVVLKTAIIARDSKLAEKFKAIVYSKIVDEAPADMTNDVATNRALLQRHADLLLTEVASWQKDFADL